jgi:hypothetical protein
MLSGEPEPALAPAGAAAAPQPPAAPPRDAPPRDAAPDAPQRTAPEPAADALDLGSLGGAMLADRLQDPRRLAGLLAVVALVFYRLGRRRALQ